jgi:hypothetical protein
MKLGTWLCALAGACALSCSDDTRPESAHGADAASIPAADGGKPHAGAAGSTPSRPGTMMPADAAITSEPADAATAHEDSDAAAQPQGRAFRLASAGTQLRIDGPNIGLQLTEANLAGDVDLVAVHQEFYGVPWQAFLDGTDPPAEWSAKMHALAEHAHAISDPLFLSNSMLNGARESLAERTTIENGQPKGEDNWSTRCYDFASAADGPQLRAAYLRYVEYMVELFRPTYLNYAIELNLFLEKCEAAAPAVIEVANAAYAAAKAKQPELIAFPSIQIDHLYGYAEDSCPSGMDKDACYDRNYQQISDLKRDRFAMSSYPYLQGRKLEDVGPDWFERAAARGGERALIAETGWLSTDLIAQSGLDCNTVIHGSEHDAALYLTRVLEDAQRIPLELVTWWSNRDLLPAGLMTNCPCDYEPTWCQVVDVFRSAAGGPLVPGADYLGEILLKAFGTMGIRDYDGKLKSELGKVWNDARRSQPVTP